jgi:uncharacterized membrane protein YqiK
MITTLITTVIDNAPWILGAIASLALLAWLIGVRYIPHSRVGLIEKLWSTQGSLREGRIVASQGEAGFQADMLRGGLHIFYFPWQYRIHRQPLVVVPEGRIGYVYARDGAALPPTQTLAKGSGSALFQDAEAFLKNGGQRGRQRAILREGVYAINLSLFVVITEDRIYTGPVTDSDKYADWQRQLATQRGFLPVVVGTKREVKEDSAETASPTDTIGIVTVHDGAPIESGEIIAPEVRPRTNERDHQYFQDPEAFLALGGRRGKQLQVLTDGTFFINRWFATVELVSKTLIPIGYVGVVVSYYGNEGRDLTGASFRYGEQVDPGQRGVWKKALPPGKYPLNPYAVRVELVPTVNFVLRWITGQTEAHQYDKDLTSIELITADGYEPTLPLSLVLHIDYEKAPSVIQRFGDVKRLISQTLDPIISAYFRDVAQSSHMLELLTHREDIQARATAELGRRFTEYDINCIAVLIGRPQSQRVNGDDPIERLFDQLRLRRLADEQKETFAKQEEAAEHQKSLNDAMATAAKQAELTQTRIDVEISANRGESQLAEAQRLAQRDIARAEGEWRSAEKLSQRDIARAEGEARSRELVGRGEASRVAQIGASEAAVFDQKIRAWGDSRLLALNLVSEQLAKSVQPLVPERLVVLGGDAPSSGRGGVSGSSSASVLTQLLTLLLAERASTTPPSGAKSETGADVS